jgi:methyl-accepting chemotaxis protein
MIKDISLQKKLLFTFLAVGILPLSVATVIVYSRARADLSEKSLALLESKAMELSNRIETQVFDSRNDVNAFAFHPFARGPKEMVELATNTYMNVYDIYDLMVVADLEGTIIAANTLDARLEAIDTSMLIGRNVKSEKWFVEASSGRIAKGDAYVSEPEIDGLLKLVTGKDTRTVTFATPIRDATGAVERVWATRMSWERSVGREVSEHNTRLRKSGYLDASIFVIADGGLVLGTGTGTDAEASEQLSQARASLEHEKTGAVIVETDHGPMAFGFAHSSSGYAVMVEQPVDQVLSAASGLRNLNLLIMIAAGVLIYLLARWLAHSMTDQLSATVALLERVAEGDLSQQLNVESKDELGRIAEAVNRAVFGMERAVSTIRRNTTSLSEASGNLSSASSTLDTSVTATSGELQAVARRAQDMGNSAQAVSQAVTAIAESVQLVARNTLESSQFVEEAVSKARATDDMLRRLQRTSEKIGSAVSLIHEITEQTDLLALNAAIEAAHAGAAGQGFAVVAQEVKELARRTNGVTQDIRQQIGEVRREVQQAVSALADVCGLITRLHELQVGLATQTEDQTRTTRTMAEIVFGVTEGCTSIARSMEGCTRVAEETRTASTLVIAAASRLSSSSRELQASVAAFK